MAVSPPAARASDNAVQKWLIAIGLVLIATLPLLHLAITVPLSPLNQARVSAVLLLIAIVARFSVAMRPMIIFLSGFASMRYFYWRITSTVSMDTPLDMTVSLSLLAAETYGIAILFLGYFQTVEIAERTIPAPRTQPTVDVFIATYNESIEIVRRTVIGALGMDYPFKTVYLLDDGRRPEMEALANALGCEYLARGDNRHAKAGNLNHALARTSGELIAIFDADHVPVRAFLQRTVGGFEDAQVALVQAAQHFYNPDPYERNLDLVGRIAPEQTFFYRVIQPGNDFWNSAFFCGSCAVLRRSALLEIGGFKTQTVTEDAHTALELHARGYRSIYQPLPLAAGLATESFAAHVRQRMRWARGMVQILRVDCPLWKRGLALPQRLNYLNAIVHFLFGVPRIILIVAPLAYLLFGIHPIKADALAVFAYILPHIGLSIIANSMISRHARHSFWAAVYEISIAPFTAAVTFLALVNPRLGKFDVTEKGTRAEEARFDLRRSWVTLGLLAVSGVALTVALPLRLAWFGRGGGDRSEVDAMLINGLWALGNFVLLLGAACVAYEQPQQRTVHRLRRSYRCVVSCDGTSVTGETVDVCEAGVRVVIPRAAGLGPLCTLTMADPDGRSVTLDARMVRHARGPQGRLEAAFQFRPLDLPRHRQLVDILFGHEDSWTAQTYSPDRPLRSFWYLLTTFWRVTRPRQPRTAGVERLPRLTTATAQRNSRAS